MQAHYRDARSNCLKFPIELALFFFVNMDKKNKQRINFHSRVDVRSYKNWVDSIRPRSRFIFTVSRLSEKMLYQRKSTR